MGRETNLTQISEGAEPQDPLPLDGVRILDLTQYLPGPFCTRLLADLGAEVLKIEEPTAGDRMRRMPGVAGPADLFFALLNHGKKSLSINLKHPTGREIFEQLTATSDAVVEGFRPGVTERLGIDFKRLEAVCPGIVYCSLTGYGQRGPRAARAGHDLNYLARSGILELLADRTGVPVIPGIQLADLVGGIYSATTLLAALRLRDRTGKGQFCDLSMKKSLLSLLTIPVALAIDYGSAQPLSKLPLSGKLACYNVYRTRDGRWISLAALEERFWERFCQLTGHSEWTGSQFREEEQERLKSDVADLFARRSLDEWIAVFEGEDVCVEPVMRLDEVMQSLRTPAGGECSGLTLMNASSMIRFPVDWANGTAATCEARQASALPAPEHGQDNALFLGLLGYSPQEIVELRAHGILGA